MPRLDVVRTPGRGSLGYVVDVQAELLSALETRTVVPLLPLDRAPPPIGGLNPVVDVAGVPHLLLTQAIASVRRSELGRASHSLAHEHDRVTRALDILLLGFRRAGSRGVGRFDKVNDPN